VEIVYPERPAGTAKLGLSYLTQTFWRSQCRVADLSCLASRGANQHHPYAGVGAVASHGPSDAEGFVVWVGESDHQGQWLAMSGRHLD
jgi:hypothetical protein